MPGGAETVGVRFDLIYPVDFNAFLLTTTGDGLGAILRYETDNLQSFVYRRMYYMTRAILSGSVRPDSNDEFDVVTFVMEFFYWFAINKDSVQGLDAREFPFWGGLFSPPGAMNDQIEPLMDPLYWLNSEAGGFNQTGLIHGFTQEPTYSIRPERINQVTAHCEITTGLIVVDTS